MRLFWIGLVTVLLVAACSDEITTTEFRAEATFQTETIVETDAPPAPPPVFDEPGQQEASADAAPATVTNTATPQEDEPAAAGGDGLFPTVVDATANWDQNVTWRVDVTLLSEYDSPARYADAWRVLDADDNELGIRVLGHDHAGEQPFTRSASVEIPDEVTTVYIEGRDQLNGWSGERFELDLER